MITPLILLAISAAQVEEDPAEEIFEVEEQLVQTASRAVDPLRLAPASISVISAAELRDLAALSLVEAASGVRGFIPSDDWTQATLGVRGVSSLGLYGNRLQVQLDGHALNEDWAQGSSVGYDLLPTLAGVERIELVRGPGSALFGTGAMSGVANLVTPSVAPAKVLHIGGGGSSGGLGRLYAVAGAQAPDGPGAWIAVGALGRAPHDVELPSYVGTAWAPDGVAHGVGDEEALAVYGKGWLGDFTLALFASTRAQQLAAANYFTVFGDVRTRETGTRSYAELRYEPMLAPGLQLLTRAYVDQATYNGIYPYTDPSYTFAIEDFASEWGGAEARVLMTSIAGLRAAVGVETQLHPTHRQLGGATPAVAPYIDEVHRYATGSLYTNVDWDVAHWLRTSAGVRLDGWYFEELGRAGDETGPRVLGSVNPRLAIIFLPSADDTFKLIGGRAFRVPSMLELTYNDGDYTTTRNPDLQPETSWSAELEYQRTLPEGFRATVALHASAIVDVIYQEGTGETDDLLRYANSDEPLVAAGVELEVARSFGEDVTGSVWAAFTRARSGDLAYGPPLENAPEVQGALVGTWSGFGPAAHVSSRLRWEGARTDREGELTPSALLVDLVLAGTVEPLTLEYAVSLKNALDATWVNPVSADIAEPTLPQPGRTVFAEVSFSF